MQFDARAAKLLSPGSHLTIDDCPGLRLNATASTSTWLYRYKSPVDGRMRQVKIGAWPATSYAAAVVKWEKLKQIRDGGRDPGAEKREGRKEEIAAAALERKKKKSQGYTVAEAAKTYWKGHVARHRAKKGADEILRMFNTMLGPLEDAIAVDVSRADAFALLESWGHIPVQAAKLRSELGAAWDYNLDAAKFPENTPNWWRLVMRGRLRSKGKRILGETIGTAKRTLSESEVRDLVPWLPNFTATVEDALILYLWTCTRGSEIVAMHATEIADESDGLWWTIPKEKTKNARHPNATDLRVPLIGRAAAVVRRRIKNNPGGFLFANKTVLGHIEQSTIQTAVYYQQPYCVTRPDFIRPRLTVARWAPHDLRRTSRTLLAAMECPDAVAEAILGHMQAGIKGIYNLHAYDKERRVWLTRLDARLEEIVAGI